MFVLKGIDKMKKNILIIVNRMTGAGPARVASNLSLNLSNSKYNKFIAIYDAESSTYELEGKKIINLNTKPTKNPIKKVFNTIKRIKTLKKIKKKYNINITISLLPNPNLVNILSRVDDKVIISERSFMSKELRGLHGNLYKYIFKNLYNKADFVIAVSMLVKQDLISNFGIYKEKIRVIYNFYDIEKILELSKEPLTVQDAKIFENPTIVTVGRLAEQKGQWHLIRALNKVKKEIPDVKLIILGEGELEDYLKKLVNDYKLTENVHFLGFQKNPFKYITKSDMYVFPSLYEGFPNALAEGMVCGLPVISSDCESGPREILSPDLDLNYPQIKNVLNGDYGILVPVCDGKLYDSNVKITKEENILANSIISLFKNQELQNMYSELAQRRMEKFRNDKLIKEWEQIIT